MKYSIKISGNVHICAVKQIMVNNSEVMDDSKGLLISKTIFDAFKSTKNATFLKEFLSKPLIFNHANRHTTEYLIST